MTASPETPEGNGGSCVLLLSGGLDSTTMLAHVRAMGWEASALTFRYGQKHAFEIEAARRAAGRFGCGRHVVIDLPLGEIAQSALTSASIDVPRGSPSAGIPPTYVPARNLVFLSVAACWAESLGLRDIFIATSSVDYSGYPDCREAFIRAFENAALLGTKAGAEGRGFRVHAPFMRMGKKDIIRLGLSLGVDYAQTSTCYSPADDGSPCGACDACLLRQKGFSEAGERDPALREGKDGP